MYDKCHKGFKMKTLVVAVSGGVDSVVLLDMLVKHDHCRLIVAHFDHGIRPDSADDARFVEELAKRYGVEFIGTREELGANASEELARNRRYTFLFSVATSNSAPVATAHHADDIIETLAINLTRGTGWQGLAVLDRPNVERPLLAMTKQRIYAYALRHRLEWVEDSTNTQNAYLRNRLRRHLGRLTEANKQMLLGLRERQVALRNHIRQEAPRLTGVGPSYVRHDFIMWPPNLAIELLRHAVWQATETQPTYPQAERALMAIKTLRPGATYQLGGGVVLVFTLTEFVVKLRSKMLS